MTHAYEGKFPIEDLLAHSGWLRALAARLVADPASADDLVQETWLVALRRRPAEGVPERSWLATVVRNLARNARREARTRAGHEADAREERTPPTPEGIAREVEAQRMLAEAVGRLAEPGRTIVVLRWFRELDSAEIGRELGMPDGTVRWRLKASLEELRADLDRRQGGREAWAGMLAGVLENSAPAPAAALPLGAGVGVTLIAATAVAVVAWRLGVGADEPEPTSVKGTEVAAAVAVAEAARTASEPLAPATRAPLATTERAPHATVAPAGELATELSGKVLLDARPAANVKLRLDLEGARNGEKPRFASSDAEGRFVFRQLEGRWIGWIDAPGYLEESGPVRASSTVGSIEIELDGRPLIVGRVLAPSGFPSLPPQPSDAYPGAVQLVADAPGGPRHGMESRLRIDDEGRFAVAQPGSFPADVPIEAALHFELRDVGRLVLRLDPLSASETRDVGDLVLVLGSAVRFRVVDADGAPIEDAFARYEDWNEPVQADGDGAGTLPAVPAGGAPIRFAAPRHVDRVLRLSAGDEPEVVLERATSAKVRVVSTSSALPELRLVVTDRERLFVDTEDSWRNAIPGKGAQSTSIADSGGLPALQVRFGPGSSGELLLRDLAPGVVFSVEVHAADGRVLAAQQASVGAGEWLELELAID